MIKRKLRDVAAMIGADIDPRWGEVVVHGVSTDTRTLQPGNLYIPIVGERFNGHEFAEAAISQGAAAVLWSRKEAGPPDHGPVLLVDDTLAAIQRLAAAYRKQLGVRIVGITGSNGKTSTKDILAAVLGVRYKTQKTFGNLNNHLGVPLTLLALEEDTEYAVVEMGMSGLGEIRELADIVKPDTAIVTNVSEVHLGDLHSRERIMQAKLEITESLKRDQLFIYNGDHERMNETVQAMNLPCMRVTFGEKMNNQLYAEEIRVTKSGVSFKTGDMRFEIPVLGKHQALNALAAIAAAKHAGLTDAEIRYGLQKVRLTGMRNEWHETAGGISIINDAYKSNPSSVRAALELMYALEPFAQKVIVLGDMVELGDESVQLHREIGEGLRPDRLDYVFTIGSTARHIAEAAVRVGGFAPERVIACSDQEELRRKLLDVAEEGTLLLVKGSRTLALESLVEALKMEEAG